MRIGCVGLGSIGRRHLGNLLALGCDVVGMDVSASARQRAQAEYPHTWIGDCLSFVDLDALVIATPCDNHIIWVEEAIRRGLPFFTEKPLGTLEQLPLWRQIAALRLPTNQVGYNWRFNAEVRAWWADDFEAAVLLCDTNMAAWPGTYGDPLLECSHEIDTLCWLRGDALGELISAATVAGVGCWAAWEHCDYMRIRWAREPERKYSASWHGFHQPDFFPSQAGIDESYRSELAHFLECVRAGRPTDVPLSEGLKTLEVCQQIEQMAATVRV